MDQFREYKRYSKAMRAFLIRSHGEVFLSHTQARYVLGLNFGVPRYLQVRVISEMLDAGFLERLNKHTLVVPRELPEE